MQAQVPNFLTSTIKYTLFVFDMEHTLLLYMFQQRNVMKNRRLFLKDSSLLIGGLFISAPLAAFAQNQQVAPTHPTPTQPPPSGPAGTMPNPQPQGFGHPLPGPVRPQSPPNTEQMPPPSATTPNPYGIAIDQRFYSTGYYQSGYYTGYYY